MNKSLRSADIAALERSIAKASLAEFTKMAWHVLEPATELKWGWALDAMCEHLEAVTSGDIKNLLTNVPPGMMKSLLTGVMWPAWEWGPRELAHYKVLGTSFKTDLAVRDNVKCRRLVESNWYQDLWSVEIISDQNTKSKFENSALGFREAMSFTSMTGSRGDRVIVDDPISVDGAKSKKELKNVEDTFNEALPTRKIDANSSIVAIMQRLHTKDMSGVILDSGLDYTHLCLPMEFDSKSRCHTVIGFTDPRTEDKELLHADRFPREEVDDLKKQLGSYATAGQLQQRPTPRGGGLLKEKDWVIVDELPQLSWCGVWADTALKTEEQHDYSVFELWGQTEDGRAILVDLDRGKWEAPQLLTRAKAFWSKHIDHKPVSMKIEDKASGTGLMQSLKQPKKGELRIPVIGIPRSKDKLTRSYSFQPHLEAGNVMILGGKKWLSDFLTEANDFPMGEHDDQLDPAFDAAEDILGQKRAKPRIRSL